MLTNQIKIMKTFLLGTLIVLLSLAANCQDQYVGISGGLSASNIIYSQKVDNPAEYRLGYLFKVNYEIEIFDHFYIATGATYQDKGFTNKVGGYASHIEVNSAHRYLGIPIGICFQVGGNLYCKLLIQANISLLLSKESHVRLFASNSKYEERTFYNTNSYSPVDLSINPVSRIGYKIGNRFSFFLETSFSVSVNPFLDITSNPTSSVVNNYAFGACIGFDFRI